MILLRAAVGALLALGLATPLPAHDDLRAELKALQQDDRRLQSIGWDLVTGNAPFCARAAPAIGLLLQDVAGYGRPDAVREAIAVEGDVAVQAVASGSPAEAAGLDPNEEILNIEGFEMTALPPAERDKWQRLKELHDRIDAELRDGTLTLSWRATDGRIVTREIDGVAACRSRFELLDEGQTAAADGMRVVIGREFAGLDYSDEQFAAALAHELAHNLLRHRAWLDRVGRGMSHVRVTEREADRLMPWLLANAGYDPLAAVRFMQSWGPRHGGGLLRKRTHDGWDERVEFIQGELPAIRAALAAGGKADWSRLFRREQRD